ncbi:accelerated cell death 11-like [Carex rostrata]
MSWVGEEKPLRKIAAAFDPLADVANSGSVVMELRAFSRACAHVSVVFGSLGIAFKFAEKDYVSKVDDLIEASKSISTLENMIELDIQQDCVRQDGSHTINLLRVLRGLDLMRVLYEELIKSDGNSLRDAASVAYEKVFAHHHSWAVRKAVAAGMLALPSKSQLLKRLNEDEGSAKVEMQSFVRTSVPVIKYVEELFNSRQLGIDW